MWGKRTESLDTGLSIVPTKSSDIWLCVFHVWFSQSPDSHSDSHLHRSHSLSSRNKLGSASEPLKLRNKTLQRKVKTLFYVFGYELSIEMPIWASLSTVLTELSQNTQPGTVALCTCALRRKQIAAFSTLHWAISLSPLANHMCADKLVLSQLFFNRCQPIELLSCSRPDIFNHSLPSEFHEDRHAPSLITAARYCGNFPGSGSSGSSHRFPFGDLLLAWV